MFDFHSSLGLWNISYQFLLTIFDYLIFNVQRYLCLQSCFVPLFWINSIWIYVTVIYESSWPLCQNLNNFNIEKLRLKINTEKLTCLRMFYPFRGYIFLKVNFVHKVSNVLPICSSNELILDSVPTEFHFAFIRSTELLRCYL